MTCNPEVLRSVPLFALLDDAETAILAAQVEVKALLALLLASDTRIVRHVRVKADANCRHQYSLSFISALMSRDANKQ
jgi:hypothetical protein